jgi:hypothetical protein
MRIKGEKMARSAPSFSSCSRRAAARWLLLSCAAAGASCGSGDATGPGGRLPPPALEPVAYEAIGSGKVMFQRIGSGGAFDAVYVIDADARRTTSALDTVSSPVFGASLSPSGEAVTGLLWTDGVSCYDVYVTDLSGGHKERLSSFSCNAEGPPAWTPDGSAVVFVVEGLLPSSAWGIYRGVLASGASEALRTFAVDTAGWIRCPAASRVLAGGQISVSVPGGLAYLCGGDIWGADRPSDALAALQRGDSLATIEAVAWSPDGDALAFIEVFYGAGSVIIGSSLRVQDRASGLVRSVATVPGSGRSGWNGSGLASLCWLPGGTRIVFSAPNTGVTGEEPMRASLYVVVADGTGLGRLTTAPDAFDHDVSCSR